MQDDPIRPVRADRTAELRMLSWVREELRLSMEQAHKALRRHLRESATAAPGDIVDPGVMRVARQSLHQAAGALELVRQPLIARVVSAAEAAVLRFMGSPELLSAEAISTIERTSFAVLDYLAHVLAGKRVSTLALFPQFRAVQELAAAERIHPADLWPAGWQWQELPAEEGVQPRVVDAPARAQLESLMLTLMRQPDRQTLTQMSDLCASFAQAVQGDAATLWKLAAAFFEAQAAGALRPDVYTKRIGPRLLALARASQVAEPVRQQLARDLLFFCTQGQPDRTSRPTPRLRLVREAFGLTSQPFPDYETARLGRFDPVWVTQARRRLAAAREVWAGVCAGELHQLPALPEQFALVGDSMQRLYPGGEQLAAALSAACEQVVSAAEAPAAALAMEGATALLVLEALLEVSDLDDATLARHIATLTDRLDRASGPGAQERAPEAWMAGLYRRVSERRTAAAAAQELRLTLAEVEKQLDQFVRNPLQRDVLTAARPALDAVRGVLAMLGLQAGAAAVADMGTQVGRLEHAEIDGHAPEAQALFRQMAANLGALGMLFDVLAVQPADAPGLLHFDEQHGLLELAPVSSAPPAIEPSPEQESPVVEPARVPEPVAAGPQVLIETVPEAALETVPEAAPEAAPEVLLEAVPEPVPEPAPAVGIALDLDLRELPVLTEPITGPSGLEDRVLPRPLPHELELPPPADAVEDDFEATIPVPFAEEISFTSVMDLNREAQPAADEPQLQPEAFKVIGPLRVPIETFNRFLNDADEASRSLAMRLAVWFVEPSAPPDLRATELAWSLATEAAGLGHVELASAASALAETLERTRSTGLVRAEDPALIRDGCDQVQRLLHLFAAGFYEVADAGLVQRLLGNEIAAPAPEEPQPAAEAPAPIYAPEPAPAPEPEPEPEP
ncbi:MAG: hypothetical protein ACOYLV_02765, partial [Rubrivivax sp.]